MWKKSIKKNTHFTVNWIKIASTIHRFMMKKEMSKRRHQPRITTRKKHHRRRNDRSKNGADNRNPAETSDNDTNLEEESFEYGYQAVN
uniref:Uncharacterized protein n=1 Tax=Acrobeloides nanus TaxID=290746 RepID=A0A914E6S0_9BILA